MSLPLRRIVPSRALGLRLSHGASTEQVEAGVKLWRQMSLYVALPVVGLSSFYILKKEFGGEGHEPPPEFKPYDHMRIRKKNFPWGDGKKSLFHNPERNALPTGYEVDVSAKH